MKILSSLSFICLTILIFSCKKSEFMKNSDMRDGYIIGFDQCTAGLQTFEGKGFVILDN